jgi:hypothetical protein
MSRKIIPFIVAFVLICLVMVVSGVFAFSGAVTAQKFGSDVAWETPYTSAESMKVVDLTGDDQDELFIQNTSDVSAYDGIGNRLWTFPYSSSKTTLADVNGDNVEDIIVFYVGSGMSVDTIINGQHPRWRLIRLVPRVILSASLPDLKLCWAILAAVSSPSPPADSPPGKAVSPMRKFAASMMRRSAEKLISQPHHTMALWLYLIRREISFGKPSRNNSAVCAPLI